MCLFWICEMLHLLYCRFFYFLQAFHKERKHALCHKNCLRFQKQKIYVKDYHFIVWLNGLSRDLFIHHIRFTTHWQVHFRTFIFQLWRFKTLNNSHLSWFIQRSISYYLHIFELFLSCIKSIFLENSIYKYSLVPVFLIKMFETL